MSEEIMLTEQQQAEALHKQITGYGEVIYQSLYGMCTAIKQMRDSKLYRALGHATFEGYTQDMLGMTARQAYSYITIADKLSEEFVKSTSQIGIQKLYLLAMAPEETRSEIVQHTDLTETTVRELKAQIAKLEADKDAKTKQFQAALDAKETQLRSAKESGERSLSECKTYLNGRIRELEGRIKELEDMPVQHDLTDADAAEEIKRLKRELEDEQLRYTMLEGSANARARKAADEVRAEYEKKLAEVQSAEKPDTKAVFKAYLANAADAMKRLLTYLESVREDENLPLYIEKLDGIVEMTQERRNAL